MKLLGATIVNVDIFDLFQLLYKNISIIDGFVFPLCIFM